MKIYGILRWPGYGVAFCKIFRITVDADFIYFAYAQWGPKQLLAIVRNRWQVGPVYMVTGCMGALCFHSPHYGHTAGFYRAACRVSDKPLFQTALSAGWFLTIA